MGADLRAVLSVLLLATACSAPAELTVDVRTDFRPVVDFRVVTTELSRVPFDRARPSDIRSADTEVMATQDFVTGQRVVELDGVELGRSYVRVTLRDLRGAAVAQRVVDLDLEESFALTVVLTKSCRELACPGTGDPEGFAACHDGRCVDPRCTTSSPEHCGEASCATDGDCAGECAEGQCIGGVCFCDPSVPDGGGVDAGVPADAGGGVDAGGSPDAGSCDCAPGETDTESQPCGNCGSGTQTRSRSCDGATCRWGAWGDFSVCTGASGCAPGSSMACANGDSCGHRVCQSDCTFGECEPIHECLRIRPGTSGPEGNNFRCCGSGQWQFCLSTCDWSSTCESCSGCGC